MHAGMPKKGSAIGVIGSKVWFVRNAAVSERVTWPVDNTKKELCLVWKSHEALPAHLPPHHAALFTWDAPPLPSTKLHAANLARRRRCHRHRRPLAASSKTGWPELLGRRRERREFPARSCRKHWHAISSSRAGTLSRYRGMGSLAKSALPRQSSRCSAGFDQATWSAPPLCRCPPWCSCS